MLLHEERPVPASRRNGSAEVSEIPGEDQAAPSGSHRHYCGIDQIQAGVRVACDEIERVGVLGVGRSVELVHALEQAPAKEDGRLGMSTSPEQEVDLDVDWPGHECAPAKGAEQCSRELVTPQLGSVTRRNEGTGVADDQSARRESTSSTRSDKSGSSSMIPA